MKKSYFLFLLILSAAFYSCRPSRPAVNPPVAGLVETGIASWYGPEFHGRPTSSREIFDQNDLTAAHPTLPFGTMVLVTNLENGRQVTVRINDRGPFVKGRIIDLSYAAARLLGMVGPGTARVRLEVAGYEPPEVKPRSAAYVLQVGSFAVEENARKLFQKLQKEFPGVYLSAFQINGQTFYRVRLKASTEFEARKLAERLSAAGYPVLLLRE